MHAQGMRSGEEFTLALQAATSEGYRGVICAVARSQVLAFDPELVVLIAPDHYNGFFNELMPPFCIGTQATSVGDYLTPAGALNVDGEAALALATHLMDADFDVAVSRAAAQEHPPS